MLGIHYFRQGFVFVPNHGPMTISTHEKDILGTCGNSGVRFSGVWVEHRMGNGVRTFGRNDCFTVLFP